MLRIFQARTCNASEGFSLIEVIVATAVVALGIAAATSTVLTSRIAERAGIFYREAHLTAEILQARDYGFTTEEDVETNPLLEAEEELITTDSAGPSLPWKQFSLRSDDGDRRVVFCLQPSVVP